MLAACNNKIEESPKSSAVNVKIASAKFIDSARPVRTAGKLSAAKESKLSFKIPGIIESISVKEGEAVRKNTQLASLNLAEIDANLTKAKQGFEKAQRDYNRIKDLYRDSVVTLEQLQNTETALEIARSEFNIAAFNKRYSVINAPSDGRILRVFGEENELVNPGYPVILFGGDSDWQLICSVSDFDFNKIKIGDKALVDFDTFNNKTFTAYVSELSQSADPYTGTYNATLTLQKTNSSFASGLIGKAEIIPSSIQQKIIVPIESIVEANNDKGYIFIPKGNKVEKRRVTLGEIIAGNIIVIDGLDEGENIISTGAEYLQQNSEINVVEN